MKLTVQCQKPVAPHPSPNVNAVAQMFGLGLDATQQLTLIPPVTVPLEPHSLVFLAGPSGSGKSTLLRLIHDRLGPMNQPPVLRFETLNPSHDRPLVDAFGDAPLDTVLRWLALAGLNEARLMLRRPSELSDGQQYRFRLARMIQSVETLTRNHTNPAPDQTPAAVVLADEFGATLDRQTAAVIARQLRKWTRRQPVCVIAATTHDDLLEPLAPDVLIEKHLDDRINVVTQ